MRALERWRLLLDGDLSGHENMARDEALLLALEEGYGMPTLRLYGWQERTLTVGYMQDATVFAGCTIPVVRRPTGGRAVLHWKELTYAVVAPTDVEPFDKGLQFTYYVINNIILATLKEIGVDAELSERRTAEYRKKESCFHSASRYEVTAGRRKLSGGAQRRLKRAFLQHGSILFSVDRELVAELFGKDAPHRMAAIDEFTTVDRGRFRKALVENMAKRLSVSFEEEGLTEREAYKEGVLVEKYLSPSWNVKGKTALGV